MSLRFTAELKKFIKNSPKQLTKINVKIDYRDTKQLKNALKKSQSQSQHYRNLINGQASYRCHGKVALPTQTRIKHRVVHAPWPRQVIPLRTRPAIAAREHTQIKAHSLTGADGGQVIFHGRAGRTYNVLNDKGLQINARYKMNPGTGTHIGQVGYLAAGRGGYSRVLIATQSNQQLRVQTNGRRLAPGQSTRLADGGTLHLGRSGRHAYIRSQEGYRTAITIQGNGLQSSLKLRISASSFGVKQDEIAPKGLLGNTFDRGSQAIQQIAGSALDYETAGLFSRPRTQLNPHPLLKVNKHIGAVYQHYFKLKPQMRFSELERGQVKNLWEQTMNKMTIQNMTQSSWNQQRQLQTQDRKVELLLMAALNSGNMDLAVLMLSGLETRSANKLTQNLVKQIHQLQQQRQQLSAQMSQTGSGDNATSASQLQSLTTKASNIGTEISLLQTFLQDAMSSKRNTQEFASNWIRQSHETSRSIIQNIGR